LPATPPSAKERSAHESRSFLPVAAARRRATFNFEIVQRLSRRLIHALIATLVFLGIAGTWWLEETGRGDQLTSWEYRFRDTITTSGRRLPPDSRLLFLGIDDASVSIDQLDLQSLYADVPAGSAERRILEQIANGWPWSREVYASLAERLLRAGARGVIFDLLLTKPGNGDDILRATIARYQGRILLGENFAANTFSGNLEAPSLDLPTETVVPNDNPGNPSLGYVNFWPGYGGVVRSAHYWTTIEQLAGYAPPAAITPQTPTSLAARGAHWLGMPTLKRPFVPRLIRFSGPPGTYVPMPVYQAFIPKYWRLNFGEGSLVRDKIVLVGPAGARWHDEAMTPFGLMGGPELHLHSLNALIHRAFLREWGGWVVYLLIALACLGAWALTAFVSQIWWRLVAFLGAACAFLFAIKLAYDYASVVVPGIPPVFAFSVTGLSSLLYDYTRETLEKLRVRRTLEAYVSREVVRDILDNPASYLNALGGERTRCALIMTDLRGFTTMAEELESHQLVSQLNEYLSAMVEDVFAFRGSIDKFIGDAILAVWGHLNSTGPADDARSALRAVLQMQESLARLNADWSRRGLRTFEMGCAVNYGEVIFGNIGSAKKMEPTVIGDTVNVTARLEGMTKQYGRTILIGEAAAELVRDEFRLQFVDRVALKGKTRALDLYSFISTAEQVLDQIMQDYLVLFAGARDAYREGSFAEATRQFQRCLELCPEDTLTSIYLQRCEIFLRQPPEENWDGVWIAERK
jgi:adenylate cyclase